VRHAREGLPYTIHNLQVPTRDALKGVERIREGITGSQQDSPSQSVSHSPSAPFGKNSDGDLALIDDQGEIAIVKRGTVAWGLLLVLAESANGEVVAVKTIAKNLDLVLAESDSEGLTVLATGDDLSGSEQFDGTQVKSRGRNRQIYSELTEGEIIERFSSNLRKPTAHSSADVKDRAKRWRAHWVRFDRSASTVTLRSND